MKKKYILEEKIELKTSNLGNWIKVANTDDDGFISDFGFSLVLNNGGFDKEKIKKERKVIVKVLKNLTTKQINHLLG